MGLLGGLGKALGGAMPGMGALANSKVGKVAMPGVGKVLGGQKMPAAAPAPAAGGAVGAPGLATAGGALGSILGQKARGMAKPAPALAQPAGPSITAGDPGMQAKPRGLAGPALQKKFNRGGGRMMSGRR